jgi:hypothetical protein
MTNTVDEKCDCLGCYERGHDESEGAHPQQPRKVGEVARFDVCGHDDMEPVMDGPWVAYTDLAPLLAELEAMRVERDALRAALGNVMVNAPKEHILRDLSRDDGVLTRKYPVTITDGAMLDAYTALRRLTPTVAKSNE